jgi:hypothetical protein
MEISREIIQIYLEGDGVTAPRRQLVAVQSVWLNASIRNRYRFEIPIDPFWLRRYSDTSDTMDLPASGTQMTLSIYNGPSVNFVW